MSGTRVRVVDPSSPHDGKEGWLIGWHFPLEMEDGFSSYGKPKSEEEMLAIVQFDDDQGLFKREVLLEIYMSQVDEELLELKRLKLRERYRRPHDDTCDCLGCRMRKAGEAKRFRATWGGTLEIKE